MIQRHPRYWFDDGDMILHQKYSPNNEMLYRIHHSRFDSPKLVSSQLVSQSNFGSLDDAMVNDHSESGGWNGCKYIVLDQERVVDTNAVVVLLDHIYGRNVLSTETDLPQMLSMLQITGPNQLDIPTLHKEVKEYFVSSFPSDAQELANFQCQYAEQAMALAFQYNIRQPQKPLLYYLATQTHTVQADPPGILESMSNSISILAHNLSTNLISFFTPLLFTPPPTSHMECTDALAEHWMPLVISPAIEDSAMGKPLQTLQKMKSVNWSEYAICEECVRDKKEEWSEEQRRVWKLLDEWISGLTEEYEINNSTPMKPSHIQIVFDKEHGLGIALEIRSDTNTTKIVITPRVGLRRASGRDIETHRARDQISPQTTVALLYAQFNTSWLLRR
ncbi:hypothetical protein J3R30DRAFT_3703911 [Lentinula aciculospora]|uniref:Uncharacterized protein n=1 Tax=Lentinula aciculospora TaxID=153920 RepID=A0A9W9A9C9_9AGAR|nr:hypothetical protein J3R30DRAFT_3703911 [Lentinula aciculospora]